MLVKITTYNNTVYKFASKTTDTTDGIYLGRLRDDLSLTSMASASGTVPASQNLTIYNADNYISKSENFWGASLLLTQENGLTWLGKVTFFNFDSDGNLYLTASEKGAPELELQLPDEVRQVYTIDNNFHQSSTTMTIPLAIGGSTANPLLLPTILIDKTEGVYLICVGEIRSILKVYNGTEELPSSAYQAYTGNASQSLHPGFAYVKINEDYRTNTDGSYAEINVELVGLKLGTHTEAECRNGARFLLWFLKTASSGINGWGCGIPESEIDVASFNSAISLVDLMDLKLDGIMWLRQSAQNWIDQICQAIHGSYSIGSNGKRKLTIDYAGAASKKTFNASKIILNKYGKNSYVSTVYNKGILSYGYNPITGLFMQSAQFENTDSIAQIGEQKFVGESYLIQDASTALAILEYNCKKSLSSAEAIDFTTDDLTTDLFAGDIITLDRSDIGITGEFQITSISTSDTKSEITAVRFDRSVFTVTGSHSNVNWGNEKNITPALTPAQATNLLLSTGFDINQDGTGNPYISGTFTVPEGGWLAAAVQYGIGANPTNFTELALITEGRFKIQPVNVGTVYTIRVRMITANGHSDYITGQITSTGDTVPPAIPTIVLNSTEKSVIVKCAIDNPPSDMGGFQIWRKKHTEEVFTLVGNVAANFGYASFPDHVETFVEYDYKAKSYDRSGNLSDFSQVVSITPTGLEATEIAATAIAMPTGSILRLSAKNCTTESIAQANGVKDVSGWGHHGQAFGGVTVLDGGEGFSFNGSSGYLKLREYSSLLQQGEAWTIVGRFKPVAGAGNTYPRMFGTTKYNIEGKNTNLNVTTFNVNDGTTQTQHSLGSDFLPFNEEHHAVFVQDGETLIIYKDGVEFTRIDCGYVPVLGTEIFFVGKQTDGTSQCFKGTIKDFCIYPRALSDNEAKTLYMFPDDAVFGQLTSDLIGANVINANNLVKTESLITNTAQIQDAIITDAKISGKISANHIQTNDIVIGDLSGFSDVNSAISTAQSTANTASSTASTANTTANTANSRVVYQYGTCATAAATAAKVVVLNNYLGYFTGSRISVKFTYANTAASPTLNVNSKGAKAIYAKGAAIAAPYNWEAGDTVDFVYNGSQWELTSISGTMLANTANTRATYQYGTCATAAATAAKVVTLANFVLFKGAQISVKFTYTNSVAKPTLNVNSSGAKAIYAKGAALTASSQYAWAAGDTVDFVYNGSQWELKDTSVAGNIYTANTTTIAGGKITTETITATQIAANAITSPKIATDAIKSRDYSATANDGSVFSSQGTFINLAGAGAFVSKYLRANDSEAEFAGKFKSGNKILNPGLSGAIAYGDTDTFYLKYGYWIQPRDIGPVSFRLVLNFGSYSLIIRGIRNSYIADFTLGIEGFGVAGKTITVENFRVGTQPYLRISGACRASLSGTAWAQGFFIDEIDSKVFNISDIVYSVSGTQTSISTKTVHLGNTNAVVVDSYINGTTWYRKWSDGWIEQGGITSAGGQYGGKAYITFSPIFSNTNYCFQSSPMGALTGGGFYIGTTDRSNTSITVTWDGSTGDPSSICWFACGY